MGRWSEHEFGAATLPPRAYLFAGTSTPEKIEAILREFGEVLYHRHDVYERYRVEGPGGGATVHFQLYGAPIMCDLVTVLRDGGVSEAIFFGTAFGFADALEVGDRVVPTRVQALDGVTERLGAGRYVEPDTELVSVITAALRERGLSFREGKSVSVPATLWHGDETLVDPDVLALELEFAAFCHCARVAGLAAGGVLVISDTRRHGLLDPRPPADPCLLEAFHAVHARWRQRMR